MKKKKLPIIQGLILAVLLFIFFYCAWQCYLIWKDYHDSEEAYSEVRTEFITETEPEENEPELPFHFKDIDWGGLKAANPDVIAWIEIPGTVIDYPVMQSDIADYYLHVNFEKKKYSAGSIFMETLNHSDFSDKNTIIYGHNMKNGSMFSCLKNYLNEDFNKEHPYVLIYTPEWNKGFCVTHAFVTDYTSSAYELWFEDISYREWGEELEKRSSEWTMNNFDPEKKTITLSTCHGKAGTPKRMIVQLQEY